MSNVESVPENNSGQTQYNKKVLEIPSGKFFHFLGVSETEAKDVRYGISVWSSALNYPIERTHKDPFPFNYHRRIRVRHGHPCILNKQPVRGRFVEWIYGLRVLNIRCLVVGCFCRDKNSLQLNTWYLIPSDRRSILQNVPSQAVYLKYRDVHALPVSSDDSWREKDPCEFFLWGS